MLLALLSKSSMLWKTLLYYTCDTMIILGDFNTQNWKRGMFETHCRKKNNWQKKRHLQIAFTDFEHAFDSLKRKTIINDAKELGIPEN